MKRFLYALNAFCLTLLSAGILITAPAAANSSAAQQDACNGLSELGGGGCNNGGTDITHLASGIVTILSIIVGIAAVIMIIVAGFKYVTSSGDSSNISSAKTTLIYALVGLGVAALAQFMVHFVINRFK